MLMGFFEFQQVRGGVWPGGETVLLSGGEDQGKRKSALDCSLTMNQVACRREEHITQHKSKKKGTAMPGPLAFWPVATYQIAERKSHSAQPVERPANG